MNYATGFIEFLKPSTIYRHCFRPRKAKNLNLDNKKVLITGGNRGIGLETVKYITEFADNTTVTVCARSDFKEQAEILSNEYVKVDHVKLDLSDLESISETVKQLFEKHQYFDVVICNAGIMHDGQSFDSGFINGVESCFLVNHLGHFSFVNQVLNKLNSSGQIVPERVVIVSSTGHYFCGNFGIDVDDISISSKTHPYRNWKSFMYYTQSKAANIYHVKSLSEKLPLSFVHAVHPGCVNTDISGNVFRLGFTKPLFELFKKIVLRSPFYGIQTTIHAAFSENKKVVKKSGCYFENCRRKEPASCISDDVKKEKLWEYSVRMTGVDLGVESVHKIVNTKV